jgi:hypothetical protein
MSTAAQQAAYRKHRHLRGPRTVDATGTRRRLQALAAIGWSTSEIERHAGVGHGVLVQVLNNRARVTITKRDLVAHLYARLAYLPRQGGNAGRVRADAVRRGWPSPLAWNDIDRDAEPADLSHLARMAGLAS